MITPMVSTMRMIGTTAGATNKRTTARIIMIKNPMTENTNLKMNPIMLNKNAITSIYFTSMSSNEL
jgi:hypothetical protein